MTINIPQKIFYSLQIAKVPLCLLIAFSASFGFIFYAEEISVQSLIVFASLFLLSCGGATLNSYQEREADGRLARTSDRPLVHRKLSNLHACIQAAILAASGLLLLLNIDTASFIAGIAGLVLYNFVYTPLKSKTIYSIIPGALCGAAPPYIGWLAAGGEYLSYRALLPVMLLIFWQIPHFFLVLLKHRKDYLQNMLPTILNRLSESGVRRIFLPWVTSLVSIMLIFTVIPSGLGDLSRVSIVFNALFLLVTFYYQLLSVRVEDYNNLFQFLNISIFLHMFFFSLGVTVLHG